jgi:hypothetical protein
MFNPEVLFYTLKENLSGKGLARCRFSARFQPLPIRTAREVFPQAAHPANFIKKGYGTYRMVDTFIGIPLRF